MTEPKTVAEYQQMAVKAGNLALEPELGMMPEKTGCYSIAVRVPPLAMRPLPFPQSRQ